MFETAWIPWLSVRLDPRLLVHGKFEPREVIVSQPTLRLCRRRDGTWNLQGLIADPWPGPVIKNPPPIVIRNGTVELFGVDEPRCRPGAIRPPAGSRCRQMREPGNGMLVVAGRGKTTIRLRGSRGRPWDRRARQVPAVSAASGQHPRPQGADSSDRPGQSAAWRFSATSRCASRPAQNGRLHFDGSAHGDLFEKLNLEGSFDPATGDVVLGGELAGLTLSDNLRRRLPPEFAPRSTRWR